jgi:hypothetical protein
LFRGQIRKFAPVKGDADVLTGLIKKTIPSIKHHPQVIGYTEYLAIYSD